MFKRTAFSLYHFHLEIPGVSTVLVLRVCVCELPYVSSASSRTVMAKGIR